MSNNTSASRLGEFTGGFPPRNRSAERPSNSVTLGQGIGNGANGWREPNNIWSQTFTSRTRESSRTREVGNLLDSAKDMMEGGKGSGSLVASSEVDATVCNPHRWGSAEANRRYLRSTGGSPVRRGSTQFPVGQPFLDNSQGISQFPSQSRASISTSSMRPTNGSFGGLNGQRYNDSLPNGLKPFHRYSDDPVLFQDPLGPWPDALSPYSPTDERRTRSTSEYVGSAPSTAASRNGSLPGSTYENESVQFPNADILAQLGQASTVPRGHNSSFSSQSNGRVGSDRHSSQGSDVAAMLQQFHLNNGSEQSNFPQKSLFGNTNNNLGSQQNPSDYTYPRHLRQDLSLNQDEGRLNGGSLTPDGFPSVQSSDNLNGLHVIGAGDRGVITPNGSEFRHSPYYSTGDTPPATFDPVYSRNDQHRPLANTALLDRKLSRLQQEQQQQQQQQQRFLQAPYQPMLPPQFRHQFSPYASPYGLSNGLSVPPVGPNMPLAPSMQATFIPPGIIANVEPPRAPSIDGISIRSQKLEDFKMNSKNKIFTLRDITGHFVEFSGDQNGSRFIQQKLESANSDEKQAVFEEILPNVMQLMQDVFGNYVIQKFFEHGDQTQKKMLANKMKGHVLSLSLGMYGCRVVQKALEHVLVDQQISLIKELDTLVMKCVKDQNGNHVIQKAIECVAHEHIQFIFDAFSGQIGQLAIHQYGCRVIQRILERGSPALKQSIIQELHQCGSTLISDQFGNYVTQGVILLGSDKDKDTVINLVKANLMAFSRHKYASNVVEKCLTEGSDEQKHEMMMKVLERTDNRDSNLISMIKDQYANYVLQRFLDTVSPADYRILVEALQPEMVKAKRLTSGKQITAIEKKMHRFLK